MPNEKRYANQEKTLLVNDRECFFHNLRPIKRMDGQLNPNTRADHTTAIEIKLPCVGVPTLTAIEIVGHNQITTTRHYLKSTNKLKSRFRNLALKKMSPKRGLNMRFYAPQHYSEGCRISWDPLHRHFNYRNKQPVPWVSSCYKARRHPTRTPTFSKAYLRGV